MECLRDRGVEAFGVDISEYAIGEVRPDIRRFCRVASATEPLSRRYDLIVCIEVLEHMPAHEGQLAIANMCRGTGDVLFSSTPDNADEPTHVNVKPRFFWIERFAEQGFAMDLELDAGFVAPHAMRFRAGQPAVPILDALLAQRDRRQAELAGLRHELAEQTHAIAAANAESEALREALARQDRSVADLRSERDRLGAEAAALRKEGAETQTTLRDAQAALAAQRAGAREAEGRIHHLAAYVRLVHSTIGWRILERARRYRDRLAPGETRRGRVYARGRDRVAALLGEGGSRGDVPPAGVSEAAALSAAADPAAAQPETIEPPTTEPDTGYQAWLRRHRLTSDAIAAMRQRLDGFTYRPRVSIVTPVYDTHEAWLRRMVASVRAQIYPDWELCLVDDGSTDPRVRPALEDLAAADPRIRVRRLLRNEGIAAASALALQAATGEFVALVDHDDELTPDALFEVVARLAEDPELDLLYSDEDKLDADGRRVEPFFKPDWSPDLLLSMNYIAT